MSKSKLFLGSKWTQLLTTNMGIDEADFVKDFIAALSNKTVIKKMKAAIVGDLEIQISHLQTLVKRRDDQITTLEQKVTTLQLQCDELEQYSRHTSLQIEGIPDRKVGSVIYVLDAMSLEPNVTMDSIDRVYRLGVWGQSNSKPRAILVKLAIYKMRKHIFSAKKVLRNIILPHKYYKESLIG